MEQSDRWSSLPRLPWIHWGYSISHYDKDNRDFQHHEWLKNLSTHSGGLPAQTTLKQTACAPSDRSSSPCLPAPWLPHPEAGMTPNLCSVHALKAPIKQTSFLPFQCYCHWVFIYLCTIFHFLIYYCVFIYVPIYLLFCFFILCVMDSELPLNLKMLLFNETLYMHDSAVEEF